MTYTRTNRFLTLGFMVSAAILTLMSVFLSCPAQAMGDATRICAYCTMPDQFAAVAQNDAEANHYGGTTRYWVLNPSLKELAIVRVFLIWDQESHGWLGGATPLTGSVGAMRQAWDVMVPDGFAPVEVPTGVAATFTGSSEAPAVSAWLAQHFAGAGLPLDALGLVAFSGGAWGEYQVIDTAPLTFQFILNTGHSASGQPLNDSGQPITTGDSGQPLGQLVDLLEEGIEFEHLHDAQLEPSTHQLNGCVSGCTTVGDIISAYGLYGVGTGLVQFVGAWTFTQDGICGSGGCPAASKPNGT